jgi:hypothetical protein
MGQKAHQISAPGAGPMTSAFLPPLALHRKPYCNKATVSEASETASELPLIAGAQPVQHNSSVSASKSDVSQQHVLHGLRSSQIGKDDCCGDKATSIGGDALRAK